MRPLVDLRSDRLLLLVGTIGIAMLLLGRLYSVRGAEWLAAMGLLGWFAVRLIGRWNHYREAAPTAFRLWLLLSGFGMLLAAWFAVGAFVEDMR